MNAQRLNRIISAMPLGMGGGLFRAQDLRALTPLPPPRAELNSLRGDWLKIGNDFRVTAQKLEAEISRSR